MKDKQYNGKKNKNKRTNNYLQNITQKTKDGATWTPLKTGDELGAQEGLVVSAPYATPIVKLLTTWTSSDMEIVLDTSITKNNINKTWSRDKSNESQDGSSIVCTGDIQRSN